MPDSIDIGIVAYPGPILLLEGFQGVHFAVPVKIRLPQPYPAGYPSGQVRLLCMEDMKKTPHEWKDVTDQIHCIEDKFFIELRVNHFSW
jgi:hypothetical protein